MVAMNVIGMNVVAVVSVLAAASAVVSATLADRRAKALVPVRVKRERR